ncbi:MAG: ATP synthase F1 subunit epsilon [Nitrospirae bacterium]|nr:ATP synthase F1 subunit epsilon [Nitrospirota bacterium]
MAETVKLEVVTPARAVLDVATAEVVQLPGRDGMFGVLPAHAPLMATLGPGIVEYMIDPDKDVRGRMVVAGGFAIVRDDVVTVLAETAELPEEIDAHAAQAQLADAKAALGTAVSPDEEQALHDRVALAEARIEAVARA